MNPKIKKLLFSALRIIGIFYILLIPYLYFFQHKLIFYPDHNPVNKCKGSVLMGGEYVEEKIDNTKIRYLYFNENHPKTLVFFHGNAGSICHRLSITKYLLENNYNVYLFEYPGFGGDDINPGQDVIFESATAFINKINTETYTLYGESLGSGVATFIASTQPKNLEKLILQSPYPSIVEIGKSKYPFAPIDMLIKHKFKVDDHAKKVNIPVHIFTAGDDTLIPVSLSRTQEKNFSNVANFFVYEGAAHNGIRRSKQFWNDFLKVLSQ